MIKYHLLQTLLFSVTSIKLVAVAFAMLWITNLAYAGSSVNSVRLSQQPDRSRIVFDLSGPVRYRLFMVSDPERIMLDLPDATINAKLPDSYIKPLIGIRHGIADEKLARVVVELTKPGRVSSFLLEPERGFGHRLVVDIFPIDAPPIPQVPKIVSNRDVLVVIDAGHGGNDYGATAQGVNEKNLVFKYAKTLAVEINRRNGLKAVLTRNGDYKVPLSERILIARKNRADFFLSIHANVFPQDSQVSGFVAFALSDKGASSEIARWLEESEKFDSDVNQLLENELKQSNINKVILDLSMTSVLNQSLLAGRNILSKVSAVTKLHSSDVETADFAVLQALDVPALLLELGFMSNTREVKKLSTKAFRRKLVVAIVDGVELFFNDYPPFGSKLAALRGIKLENANLYYTVRKNDTISEIAVKQKVAESQLRRLNNLEGHKILVGQKLKLR